MKYFVNFFKVKNNFWNGNNPFEEYFLRLSLYEVVTTYKNNEEFYSYGKEISYRTAFELDSLVRLRLFIDNSLNSIFEELDINIQELINTFEEKYEHENFSFIHFVFLLEENNACFIDLEEKLYFEIKGSVAENDGEYFVEPIPDDEMWHGN